MASTAPSGDDKPAESAPGNPTGPDPPANRHRNIEPPAPVMSSSDDGTSVTGTTEDFYPPPLWALAERPCSPCARKRMLREKWEAARGLDPLACPRSDDGVPSSPSAPVQGPGTELQDPLAPPATWWCDPCEQHRKSLRDWRLRREGKLTPPPPPPPPPPSGWPFYFGIPVLGSTKSILKLGRRLQEQARRGKKRPLSVAEERGYRECDVGKKVMRHKRDGPPRDTAGFGAAARVRDALTKMMPDKRRGARRVDYSKLTPLVGSREPSSSAEAGEDVLHDDALQIIEGQPEGLHEGSSAQRFALQVSMEFMRLLDPQVSSSAAAGGDLDGRLDEEAIDNLLNGEGMEDIVKTSIPKAYSKEILYDLIMECVAQYRKWLLDNRDKLDKEKYEKYQKQLVPMVDLTLVYDKEPENLSKIMKLMYKVGEYGPPPSGVIHAISPRLYQSTMEQLAAAGAVDVLHDKVPQVIKAQTEGLHEGCSAQRWVGPVSTEFMRLLDPEVGSGAAPGGDLDRRLDEDAIDNLLNVEGMQDIVKTSIPKVYSKEILYELFKEYVEQYPKWLEDNKDKLDKEKYDQYVKQFESMVNLTAVYDDEPENFSTIMKLMYKIGEYGPPPSGVIHAASPRVYESTMQKVSTGMVELLQNYDKLFSVDTSPTT